jgi:2-hydroxychromene-2-carboxylate isomerase
VRRPTAEMYDVPISFNPHFPINTLGLMRLAVAAQKEGVFDTFHEATFPAFWQQGLDLGDIAVQSKLLSDAGLDAAALLARAGDDDVKGELRSNTEEAVSRGAFGAPTFFVDGEMFFGVDHLPHLARFLDGGGSAS